MKTIKITISFLLLSVLTIASTYAQWGSNTKIKGNGNVITQNRSTSEYEGVSVGGSFTVVLIAGKEGNITLNGEENILPYIVTEVKRGTLQVRYKKNTNVKTTRKLTVTVPVEAINQVSLGGSGDVESSATLKANNFKVNLGGSGKIDLNLDASNVTASIGGSGKIVLGGSSKTLRCSIAGSASIKAYDLKTIELNANISGSGSIRTTVSEKIKAKVVGSGSIYYKGKPKYIDSKSVGSGDVIDRN